MLSLPTNPELRSLFQTMDLVEWKTLPTFRTAIMACRNVFSDSAVRRAHSVCIRANGEIWLISVGPKGGWKKLWNFGNPMA